MHYTCVIKASDNEYPRLITMKLNAQFKRIRRNSWSLRQFCTNPSAIQQERIGIDGAISGTLKEPYVIGTYTSSSPVPTDVVSVSQDTVDVLAHLVQSAEGKTLVITGAGVSTESDIPDYRGPQGAYSTGFKPMTHQQFMASESNRQRYWARSFAGWDRFSQAEPNAAHQSIAKLQKRGWFTSPIITQNVDRLHRKAGAEGVLELHGTTHEVVCTSCHKRSCRAEFQELLKSINPSYALHAKALLNDVTDQALKLSRAGTLEPLTANLKERGGLQQRPDGDVEISTELMGTDFAVPPCDNCGGALKPHVVFFGDSLPPMRVEESMKLAAQCQLMLIVGSSLAVWSAYRLVKVAKESGQAKIAIVNAGLTRGDGIADMKVEGRAGEVLSRLADHPSLALPCTI